MGGKGQASEREGTSRWEGRGKLIGGKGQAGGRKAVGSDCLSFFALILVSIKERYVKCFDHEATDEGLNSYVCTAVL